MTDTYTIYIVNQNPNGQLFWAFLAQPEVSDSPKVFANSDTNLYIAGGSQDLNSFKIPVQYVIGAGASNNAVGLNTVIESNSTRNSDLTKLWDVTYANVPPRQGPTVPTAPSGTSPSGTLAMKTNPFDQQKNAANEWYESMSFGVKTSQGFMGITWNPAPNKTYTITPKLVFYISVGYYSSYSLADITAVANESAKCNTSKDFDVLKQCTVVYSSTGEWTVKPGKPPKELLNSTRSVMLNSLV
ncbi:MAG: hypothetical protein IM550_04765 [Microcystis sp. M54BS1]|jgi:hypothetical protein|uniref:hypothetical protein n=1 Tax=unclassified Microcystis TaxID=2643300 RepID=UPI001D48FD00|nr:MULTISPECIES: hypothetical protein [unclassified Microcystis]MBE5229444.1 hypothetical protein [Microcystis aeruginosa PMC 728.11]MCA2538568.1 hypothetical protein [Microcystis sp. M54BS1]MCA2595818.1 hypothetical protein [Microcystis sp. M38BS1]MCA2610610.1 hypothetical protein [Microcystis sp. M27BS1]MCA2508234.1 hypothetical protein [Microcystis sp. M62BS1]